MSIIKICNEILDICQDDNKTYKEYKYKLYDLNDKLLKRDNAKSVENTNKMIAIHQSICLIKNRKARYIEEYLAKAILIKLPLYLRFDDENYNNLEEIEVLKESYANDENVSIRLRLTAKAFNYALELLNAKPDKSKRFKNRIIVALECLKDLQLNYLFEKNLKPIFYNWIEDKEDYVQFYALEGLETWYAIHDEKISKQEIERLEKVIKTTKYRANAATACNVLIKADVIEEFGALNRMDAWKRKNYR